MDATYAKSVRSSFESRAVPAVKFFAYCGAMTGKVMVGQVLGLGAVNT